MAETGILDRHPARALLPPALLRILRAQGLEEAHAVHALELALVPPDLDAEGRRALAAVALALLAAQAQGHTRLPLRPAEGSAAADLLRACGFPGLDVAAFLADPRLARVAGGPGEARPLVAEDGHLYTHRLRAAEVRFRDRLRAVDATPLPPPLPVPDALFTDPVPLDGAQRRAVEGALGRPLALVTGGPGTGKTTILVALLRALVRQGLGLPDIAFAAPTGKAAQRMGEALLDGLSRVRAQEAPEREILARFPEPRTLHRLLEWHPGPGTFRRNAEAPLPFRAVIVDEASMIGQELMDRLFQALAPGTRIVLLGDARQLPSVESGAAFGDLVAALPDRTSWLHENYRMRRGDAQGGLILEVAAGLQGEALAQEPAGIRVLPDLAAWTGQGVERLHPGPEGLRPFLRRWFDEVVLALDGFRELANRAYALGPEGWREGDADAIARLFEHHRAFRILCALREAADLRGMEPVNALLHGWMHPVTGGGLRAETPFLPGEPVLMTANDYRRGLFNGDQGLVLRVRFGEELRQAAVFEGPEGWRAWPVEALRGRIELSYAMTVHRAQGSEYQRIAIVLPAGDHPALTRELLYTAVTRAKAGVTLVGGEAQVVWAANHPTRRDTGLQARL
ncbi:exodeoxyribonuclease V subunit alpha [Mesoterricola sediminis]|uniref:RecBCD enzyme subunit RecD n=1 Tax=Mesoterricola sediminis TaxID=2927980 RepID=A0AA48H559_9BACT|nr:exodeoxyribonuclease V subunit alpha [Mesoterricola sediminis]BDU77596.1 RecBCD enzyme subunit RecD [Mesoterricola sediminis]